MVFFEALIDSAYHYSLTLRTPRRRFRSIITKVSIRWGLIVFAPEGAGRQLDPVGVRFDVSSEA
jgi:hypothetical protein